MSRAAPPPAGRRQRPAYIDAFLRAAASGAPAEHVHLGHWDRPDGIGRQEARRSFADAQERMSLRLVRMLGVAPGERVLDVACGIGGTSRLLRRLHPGVSVVALNVDARQVAAGRRLGPADPGLAWTVADAVALPFADGAFDRAICIEAAFHFASRAAFLREAARVLRPGGRLVLSDIAMIPPPDAEAAAAALAADYGPWPEPWTSPDDMVGAAEAAGFRATISDATAQTWPSFATIVPEGASPGSSGGAVLRDQHASGRLRYLYGRLDRPA